MARQKNPAAVALAKLRLKRLSAEERKETARLGGQARAASLSSELRSSISQKAGQVGGKARAQKLSGKRRSEIARKAAAARWAKAKREPRPE